MPRIILTMAVAVCAPFSLLADGILVTSGAVDNQVFQRNAQGLADLSLAGSASRDGRLEVRVTRQNLALPGLDWQPAATVSSGRWQAAVKGVPAGGPYRVELRVTGTNADGRVGNILVGDLWILAGQSNMEGTANLVNVTAPHALVHSLDMMDHWLVAEDPLHNMYGAIDRIHQKRRKLPERLTGEALAKYNAARRKGAGPGLPFAVEMVRLTGVPVGLIPCADGGSSMDEWSPALKDQGGDSLYGGTLRRFRLAGGQVAGILWWQGESDAFNQPAAAAYKEKFRTLINAFRQDFGQPELPVYWVQIGRFTVPDNADFWHKVQEDERILETEIRHTGMVASIDSDLDDAIHAGTESQKHIGARLAKLACHDLFPEMKGCAAVQRGPRPVSAALANNVVKVKFSGVNGSLKAAGRVSGFTIHDADGTPKPRIYRAQVDPDDATIILLYLSGKPVPGMSVYYGYGKDPYCNVKDEAGMALPVFGPIPIEQ
ncbi:MAG: sialate O-acetylesterase [Bryobacterales bacterium]|nr:sialate O-acetylesterase [Bryobacterales bacterium]